MITYEKDQAQATLEHSLQPYFAELAQFDSTRSLEASPLYARLRPEIERVLRSVVQEDLAPEIAGKRRRGPFIRATAWNIERGLRLDSIISVLSEHPVLKESDILLLTELDYGMARTQNRFVAREIAEGLGLNYVFAPCYINLNKGSGLEVHTSGENTQALHGNALFSRYPLRRAHSLALPNGKDKMKGGEKRLGSQTAAIADVEHPAGSVRVVSLHLDAHSTQRHRHRQMQLVLDHLESLSPRLPVLIGGDWNTSTYNSRRAVYSIAGFFRRVMMGVGHVIENHYLHPERWFERGLFRELERRGYDYQNLNEPGAGTLPYDVQDMAVNTNMADWVPQWCFWFLNRALEPYGGRCSLKLDWFAGSGLRPDPENPPRVIGDLNDAGGKLSDHDAIVLDFEIK
ncbi:MAG TPA: endonuclease/exonuclease/phosphatase family protein, partial [Pyrinomonadaceae bacterium]|nr:endonuclease/exonuclease/phosphatase family protein [Pyrinomonadaceae bacterium]